MPLPPVDVSAWAPDEDFPFHPVGSKPKRVLKAPAEGPLPDGIVRGHSYLFKTAVGWQQQQVWSEVIAYEVSRLIKRLYVPRAMIAVDHNTGETGVLVQFFYGFPGEERPERLFHASEMIAKLHRQDTGRPHNFYENQRICRIVLGNQRYDPLWWVKAVAFDALIGNVDRHSQNWGFLVRRSEQGDVTYSMAPYYDNGTSLGYELSEERCTTMLSDEASLQRYIDRGKHHIGWDMQSDYSFGHFELLHEVIKAIPEASGAVRNMIRFDPALVRPMVAKCSQFAVGIPFTAVRGNLVTALIEARMSRIQKLVEG